MSKPPLASQGELPSITGLRYTFPAHGLTDAERAVAGAAYRDFVTRHGLYEDGPGRADVVETFATYCSIPGAPRRTIRRVTELLTLIIYFNDTVEQPACQTLLEQSMDALFGGTAPSDAAPSTRASAALRSDLEVHIAETPANGVAFLNAMFRTWSAFLWESRNFSRLPADLEDYRQLRCNTIAVLPFLQAWKLLLRLPASVSARHGEALRRLEKLATAVQYLANDLGSAKRDQERGQRNAVLIQAKSARTNLVSAWCRVKAEHDTLAERLTRELAGLRAEDGTRSLHRYLDELEACTWGNLLSLQDLTHRYLEA